MSSNVSITTIGTVNAKAGFLIAFNTFTFSALVLKWSELTKGSDLPKATVLFSVVLLAIAALSSLASLGLTFAAINPFLKTPSTSISRIFFGDIAKFDSPAEYLEKVTACTQEELIKDLAGQAHILAKGTSAKFGWIRRAVGAVLVELAAVVLFVVVHLITAICVYVSVTH